MSPSQRTVATIVGWFTEAFRPLASSDGSKYDAGMVV